MQKILDYYNITVHSLVCNKLRVSKMHGATMKITKDPIQFAPRREVAVYPRAQRTERIVKHFPPSNAEVKNEWSCTSICSYASSFPLALMSCTTTILRFIFIYLAKMLSIVSIFY